MAEVNGALVIPVRKMCIRDRYNAYQTKHAILRNFPVLGYFRYFFESISPEMQQYFIERETDGKPFPRNERSAAYRRAKNISDTVPFGTQLNICLLYTSRCV